MEGEHESEGETASERLRGGRTNAEREERSGGSVRAMKITPRCDRGDRESPEEETETLR